MNISARRYFATLQYFIHMSIPKRATNHIVMAQVVSDNVKKALLVTAGVICVLLVSCVQQVLQVILLLNAIQVL